MRIFVFSSSNLTNIWAGVGARTWAVSQALAKSKGTVTKAKSMSIGSVGVLYCSDTHELTTPFVTTSLAEERAVSDIWPESWGLPFGIQPLGSPRRRLAKNELAHLPSVISSGKSWNKILYVQPNFSFQTSDTSIADWSFIFERLGE